VAALCQASAAPERAEALPGGKRTAEPGQTEHDPYLLGFLKACA